MTVTNNGTVGTTGLNAHGVYAHSTSGAVSVTSTGPITTQADNSRGIYAQTGGAGNADVTNSGAIVTNGLTRSVGIVAQTSGTGNVTVTSSGANITTNGAGVGNHGINAMAANGLAKVDYSNGTIDVAGKSAGIAAWNNNSGLASSAEVKLTAATVQAGRTYNQAAVQAYAVTSGSVTIDAASAVHGGWIDTGAAPWMTDHPGLAVALGGATQTLNNAGIIDALSDRAIGGDAAYAGTLTMTNTGTVTGTIKALTSTATLNNAGLWNLRSFADTNGDGARDTLSVAVSDFGTSGANRINNSGTVALLTHDGTGTILDTTGMYLPLGYAFNTMALNSPVQGHILGVQTFDNSGIIDLTANPVAGDVLVISGGHTAGTDGGGVYIANGGTLKLNTVLNDGGANSQSDILVLDSTQLGSGATGIAITPSAASTGMLTVGNGIALVEVLNKSASAGGVFTLSGRAAASGYEYLLFHNGVGADANDGNWYLRNTVITPDGPLPIIRPEVAVNMVIPPLAIEYGYNMVGTLQDRVGETYPSAMDPVYEDREVWCKNPEKNFRCTVRVPLKPGQVTQDKWFPGAWARLLGERGFHDRNDFMRYGADYDYTLGGIQAGLDVWGREKDGNLDKAGLYVGYGHIWSDVQGQFGRHAGKVDLDGYSLGAYWTHHDAAGWYTDAVLQGTFYDSEAKSYLGQRIKPDGWGVVASLEGGYAFKFDNGWTVEPQAQLAYQLVDIDRNRDDFGIFSFGNEDSLRGRLGARVAKTWNQGDSAKPRPVTAWLRANVWHEFLGDPKMTVTALNGANPLYFVSSMGGTWGEIGVGASGQVSDTITVFGSGAYNHSLDNNGREAWDGRLGMTVKW